MSGHVEPELDTIIPVPWGQIKARWWGSKDRQPIICIHGWQDNSATFNALIPLLPEQISFLCIDLPGHGRSTSLPAGVPYYLIWDGAILLRRLQKQFGWTNISIMGHSLGAIIGFLFASVYPNEVDTVIALDAVAPILDFIDKSNRVQQIGDFIDKFLHYDEVKYTKDPVENYDEMIRITMSGHGGRVTREGCELLMTRGMISRDNGKYSFTRDNRVKVCFYKVVGWLAPMTADMVRDAASHIKCRYLNIKAIPYDEKSWTAYKEVCDIIATSAREFKLSFVKGSHHVHLNEPKKISGIITDFLLYSGEDENCVI